MTTRDIEIARRIIPTRIEQAAKSLERINADILAQSGPPGLANVADAISGLLDIAVGNARKDGIALTSETQRTFDSIANQLRPPGFRLPLG